MWLQLDQIYIVHYIFTNYSSLKPLWQCLSVLEFFLHWMLRLQSKCLYLWTRHYLESLISGTWLGSLCSQQRKKDRSLHSKTSRANCQLEVFQSLCFIERLWIICLDYWSWGGWVSPAVTCRTEAYIPMSLDGMVFLCCIRAKKRIQIRDNKICSCSVSKSHS